MKALILSCVAFSFAVGIFAQIDATPWANAESALQSSAGLHAQILVSTVTGAPTPYTIDYAKGGKYRINNPTTLWVCNGKLLWTLNKKANTYTKVPANLTPTQIPALLEYEGYFVHNPFPTAHSIVNSGSKMLHGVSSDVITIKMTGSTVARILVRKSDRAPIAEQYIKPGTAITVLSKKVQLLSSTPPSALFEFEAPAGAKLVKPVVAGATYADVDKIFQASCVRCHGGSGGLNLGTYQSLMQGGNGGKEVIAGDPDHSPLYEYVHGDLMPQMPLNGTPLSAKDQKTIYNWIKAGAKGPKS